MFWATLHLFCLYFCPPMNLTLSLLVFSRVGIFLKLQPHRASYSLPLTDHLLSHSAMLSTSQSWISAMYITSSIIRRGMSGTLCTFHVPGNALRLTIPLLLPSPNQRCSLRYAQSHKLLFLTPLPRTNVWQTDPVPPVPAQTDGLPFQVDSLEKTHIFWSVCCPCLLCCLWTLPPAISALWPNPLHPPNWSRTCWPIQLIKSCSGLLYLPCQKLNCFLPTTW